MKTFQLIAAILAVQICATYASDCYNHLVLNSEDYDHSLCSSKYGAIDNTQKMLNDFFAKKIATSYDYLLMETYYNSYQQNRPGFKKLMSGLSQQSWDDSIELVKQITKRGGSVDFNKFSSRRKLSAIPVKSLELSELPVLAVALDSEKHLGLEAFKIHQVASQFNVKGGDRLYDPEMSHYIEEQFLNKHSENVRPNSSYQQTQPSPQQSFPPPPAQPATNHNPTYDHSGSHQSHPTYGQVPPPPAGGPPASSYGQNPNYSAHPQQQNHHQSYGGNYDPSSYGGGGPHGGGPPGGYPGSYSNGPSQQHGQGAYGARY